MDSPKITWIFYGGGSPILGHLQMNNGEINQEFWFHHENNVEWSKEQTGI